MNATNVTNDKYMQIHTKVTMYTNIEVLFIYKQNKQKKTK